MGRVSISRRISPATQERPNDLWTFAVLAPGIQPRATIVAAMSRIRRRKRLGSKTQALDPQLSTHRSRPVKLVVVPHNSILPSESGVILCDVNQFRSCTSEATSELKMMRTVVPRVERAVALMRSNGLARLRLLVMSLFMFE